MIDPTQALVGQQVQYAIEPLTFPVVIKQERKSFGRTDVLISPVGGSGEKWVALDSLKQEKENQ